MVSGINAGTAGHQSLQALKVSTSCRIVERGPVNNHDKIKKLSVSEYKQISTVGIALFNVCSDDNSVINNWENTIRKLAQNTSFHEMYLIFKET